MTTIQGYMQTITAIVVHPPDLNPVFDEGIITVRLDDEAGGPFVVLEQNDQQVRVCFEEVEALVQAISQLRAQPAVQQALEGEG
jgi:hypothetical protein